MVETKRGKGASRRRRTRAGIKRGLLLVLCGLSLLALGPLYAFLATNYSGSLSLRQGISAADLQRGFEFGPVYLDAASPGRYFISALLPETPEGVWQTSFEVLDSQRRPVYRQDELRFTGEFQFQPGQRDTYNKVFRLDEGPGYYYFRYSALNGSFDANPQAPPVVEFSIRQGVIEGMALWLPAFGLLACGLLLLLLGSMLLLRGRGGRSIEEAEGAAPDGSAEHAGTGRRLLPTR